MIGDGREEEDGREETEETEKTEETEETKARWLQSGLREWSDY
jgi:hypothetical protein